MLAARRSYPMSFALNYPAADARRSDLKERPRLLRRQHLCVDLADRAGYGCGPHDDPLLPEGYDLDSSLDHCQEPALTGCR
jgi:hypothetical protein